METRTFFQRLGKIFKPQTQITTMEQENEQPAQPTHQVTPKITPETPSDLPLSPTVEVSPATRPVSMAAIEFQRIKTNDLASWAMEQCISFNGNTQGLISSLEIIIMNYKLEAKTNEEKMKGELSNAINSINDEVIKLNNQIAIIREFYIPEKDRQILQLEEQMQALENNSKYDLQTDLGNETYTILATSKARTREIIRNLQAKIIDFKTEIQKKENRIETMRKQMEDIHLFNEEIVLRRMHILFNGWMKGMEGIGATPEMLEEIKRYFEDYSKTRVRNLLDI